MRKFWTHFIDTVATLIVLWFILGLAMASTFLLYGTIVLTFKWIAGVF